MPWIHQYVAWTRSVLGKHPLILNFLLKRNSEHQFDVFQDDVNRRISIRLLVDAATLGNQYLVISPKVRQAAQFDRYKVLMDISLS